MVFPRSSSQVSSQILFFLVYRQHKEANIPGGAHIWKPIYKSEIKAQSNNRQNLLFEFNQVVLMKQDLCSGDEEKDIKFEFFVSQKNGRHKNIGSAILSVRDLRENMQMYQTAIVKSQNGTFTLENTKIQKRNTFLEYIFGGCEINLAIAIDYTLSNGKPEDRDSLHSRDLNKNQYYQALKSVGDILQYYDSDK